MVQFTLRIPPKEGKLRGALFKMNCISSESYSEDGDWLVDVRMPTADWNRLEKRSEISLSSLVVAH